MPHLVLVSLAGTRVRDEEMASLGVTLPGLRARLEAVEALPPLGLLTLAGLTPPEWSVTLHESRAADDRLVDRIVAERPTLVAISALTASAHEAVRLSVSLRIQGVRTALGGLHVTACPDDARGHADAIVVGEGEPVWRTLLEDALRDRLRPTYQGSRPHSLAESRPPRLDLLGPRPRSRFTVQTERGCPFACEFCGASRLLGPYREKPVALVRSELEQVVRHDPRAAIELADDNTFARRRDAADLLEALGAAGVPWFTEVDWRLGERPDVVRQLARAGCVQVLVGLESLVHAYRGMGLKQAVLPRMLHAVGRLQDAGVVVIGCFVVGGDGETSASIDALGRLLDTLDLGDVQLTLQTPFPGTALRQRLEREGRLLPDRGWAWHTLFDVTFQPDAMEVTELERSYRDLLARTHRADEAARRARIRRSVWRRGPRAAEAIEP